MLSKLDNLLGFKDFKEALFAHTRDVDPVKQYASFGTAIQGKLAELDASRGATGPQPTTAGLVVTSAGDEVVTADYRGVVTPADQLPLDIVFGLDLLGIDVLADARTEFNYAVDGLVGSETSPGTFTITSITKPQATLQVEIIFAGVQQGVWQVKITLDKSAAPVPPPPSQDVPPPPAPVPPQTVTHTVPLLGVHDANSFALVGLTKVTGGYGYEAFLSTALLPAETVEAMGNVELYVAYRPLGGSWQQVGDKVTGEIASIYQFYDYVYIDGIGTIGLPAGLTTSPGFVEISRQFVLPGGTFEVGFFAKLLYTLPINFADPAVLEAL